MVQFTNTKNCAILYLREVNNEIPVNGHVALHDIVWEV